MSNEYEEITIDANGAISGLEPATDTADAGGDAGWETPDAPPATESTSTSPDGGDDEGGSQAGDDAADANDDAEWEDDAAPADPKPAAKADPDDVPPEDRDPKGKVPSWRVREIREKAEREIAARDARIAELEAGRGTPTKPTAAPAAAQPAQDMRAQVHTHLVETDAVYKDAVEKLDAIEFLVQNHPDELQKHFKSADHMSLVVSQLTALREARVNNTIERIETARTRQTQDQQRAQQDYVAKIVTDYTAAIKASDIPGITKYAQRLEANASKLHVNVREMILTSEDNVVLTAAIGSNRKLFDELAAIDPTKPLTPAKLASIGIRLGKAAASYNAPVRETVVDEPVQQPQRQAQSTATRRAPKSTGSYVKGLKYDRDGTIVM